MKHYSRFLVVISILILASLACSLGGAKESEVPQDTEKEAGSIEEFVQGDVPAQEEEPVAVQLPTDTPLPTPTPPPTQTPAPTSIPSSPVGLWQGLSSLNSYRLTIRAVFNGPTIYDKNVISSQIDVGSDGESSHTRYEIVGSSEEYPEEDTSTSDHYKVGDRLCDFSSGDEEVELSELGSLRERNDGLMDEDGGPVADDAKPCLCRRRRHEWGENQPLYLHGSGYGRGVGCGSGRLGRGILAGSRWSIHREVFDRAGNP